MTFDDNNNHVCNHCDSVTSKEKIKYDRVNMRFVCPKCGKNPRSASEIYSLHEIEDK